MKKSTLFLTGMAALLLSFGLTLAGCASNGTGSTGGIANETAQAAKLAADINALEAAGGTVRVTDRVEIKTALTVPEGVTLDLTAEGALLELQDGAVLTVNGTVNATGHGDHGEGWVEGSLRIGDGAAVINGSGTINLKSKGRLLNIGGGKDRRRQLTLDGVTLVGLPDNDSSLVGINENGGLVLKSGAITGNIRVSDDWADGGGVGVHKGTFTMEGGTISGNTAKGGRGAGGGGVQIGEESVFTMTGGEITGNNASGDEYGNGGGVSIGKEAVFTMSGGEISGNTASGGRNGNGGGVNVNKGGTFAMSDGTISGNTVSSGSDTARGSGVFVAQGGTFTMEGGAISGNTAQDGRNGNGAGVSIGGGPVKEADATFTMKGGVISGNTATGGAGGSDGGGVSAGRGGVFIMEGGTIYGSANRLPAGTDASLANSAKNNASLHVFGEPLVKWGTGGTYTKGGVSQTGGSDIGGTNDTLIAVPGQ
jgi:hypothetical protein